MINYKLVTVDPTKAELAHSLIGTLNELIYQIDCENKHLESFRKVCFQNLNEVLLNEYEKALDNYLDLMDELDGVSARLEQIGAVFTSC